jgi:hypothetical protein
MKIIYYFTFVIFLLSVQSVPFNVYTAASDEMDELIYFKPSQDLEELIKGTSKKTKKEVINFALNFAKSKYFGNYNSSYWGYINYYEQFVCEVIFLASLAYETNNLRTFFSNFERKLGERQYEIIDELDYSEFYYFEYKKQISKVYGEELNMRARDYHRKKQKKEDESIPYIKSFGFYQ